MYTLKINGLPKPLFNSSRLKGLGIVIGIAIAAMAVFALTHAIKHIDYDDVLDVIERTPGHLIALATLLVAVSYGWRVLPAIRFHTASARWRWSRP
jgi:hypothetical protein